MDMNKNPSVGNIFFLCEVCMQDCPFTIQCYYFMLRTISLTFIVYADFQKLVRCVSFPEKVESTIMLMESSQGESSVMRHRLEGCKKPIRGHKKPIMNMH